MDDMNAFEDQVAREAQLEAGPARPVDVASIVRSATAAAPVGRWSPVTRLFGGGRTPAPGEGGTSMMSALRYMAAAVVVALFGGYLLAAVVGDPPDGESLPPAAESSSPLAEATAQLPTAFEGTLSCSTFWEDGTVNNVVVGPVEGGNLVRRETRGGTGRFEAEMSDPRLGGDWTVYTSVDEYFWPGTDTNLPLTLAPGVLQVAGDEGSWQMSWGHMSLPGVMNPGHAEGYAYLDGGGTYEGLSALFRMELANWDDCYCFNTRGLTASSRPCTWAVEGLIFEGDVPTPDVPQ